MVVTVKYVFGLARGAEGRDAIRLELPGGATVFEAMQRLGVSRLELHAAVNGASAADATVLCDGDEVTLIPAIQGGSLGALRVAARGAMMDRQALGRPAPSAGSAGAPTPGGSLEGGQRPPSKD